MSRRETSISQASVSWLFLLFNLPAQHSSERVKVWRRLKKFGAVQLKTSTYVLPDEPVHYERFQWLESLGAPKKKPETKARLRVEDFRGKTWMTRPRPEIDRVGSAWLLLKFIDPGAKFAFGNTPAAAPEAIPYDMFQVEFSHHADSCTFETLIERFGVRDRAVLRIAELIHDADLEDDKFHRLEASASNKSSRGGPSRV